MLCRQVLFPIILVTISDAWSYVDLSTSSVRSLTQLIIIIIMKIIITFIIMKILNSSEGGPYCELGLPGGPDMHTLSMDDFQVIFLIIIIIIINIIIITVFVNQNTKTNAFSESR